MIIVATDFSENASVALKWAEELARQHDAALVLVHAARLEPPTALEFVQWPQKYGDEIRARVKSQLDREAQKARKSGITVDCELGFGAAVDIVIAAAERRGADLVVAGTRGRTGWTRLLLGSTAARLIRKAACPVLTVHPTDAGSPRPVRTVLVPTDFSEDAGLAAEAATRILGLPGADRRLVLLHAYHVPYEATYLPASVLPDAISEADARVKHMIEEFAAKLRKTGIQVDTITCEGDPPAAILDHAKSVGADLIAMGTQGLSGLNRLLLGSTAERVAASAPCPVLTVRRASD
jgi:nucleotide-binding universal stress UspA family protein